MSPCVPLVVRAIFNDAHDLASVNMIGNCSEEVLHISLI